MLIGYVRVSKSDGTQTLAPQRDAMLAAGVDPTRIYEDLASGRHDARPGLAACLKAIQPGNALVLWKLDRLGRDLRHLVWATLIVLANFNREPVYQSPWFHNLRLSWRRHQLDRPIGRRNRLT
jgi:DNA invertase Pin-like site-specific DNA recombinase